MEKRKDKIEVKKGDCGEQIVRRYLEDRGWIVYGPETNGPHAFDRLCVKDKKKVVIAEIKTKARMNNWNATGFNIKNYKEYLYIHDKYGIEIFIFFVDEWLGKIYGNKLSILKEVYSASDGKYPKILEEQKIILFSIENMKDVHTLSEIEINELKKYTNRNYAYGSINIESESSQSKHTCAECGRLGATYLFYGDGKWYCSKEEIL